MGVHVRPHLDDGLVPDQDRLGGESPNEPALASAAKTIVPASTIDANITTSTNALPPVFFALVYTLPP
jgi:hypothetical protein